MFYGTDRCTHVAAKPKYEVAGAPKYEVAGNLSTRWPTHDVVGFLKSKGTTLKAGSSFFHDLQKIAFRLRGQRFLLDAEVQLQLL